MIELHNLRISGKFSYLWLKYVTGANLEVHCARSLKGEYSEFISPELREADLLELNEYPAEIIYLCGVAKPFSWKNNFHLAMKRQPEAEFGFDEFGISGNIVGARRLRIPPDAAFLNNHPKGIQPRFATCRNWQFANLLVRHPLLLTPQ